jgi:hypothetical protein
MRDFLDSNFLVRYATLVGPEASRTSLDVLQEWRGRPGLNSVILSPLAGPHFDEFDQCIAKAKADPIGRNVDEAFNAFKRGLRNARQEHKQKVLLVLDRFRENGRATVSSKDFRENLLEKLFLPIQAAGPQHADLDDVRALLIVRTHTNLATGQQADFDEFALARLSTEVPEQSRQPEDGFRRHRLTEFERAQLDNVFDEFIDFAEGTVMDNLRLVMRGLVQNATWSPSDLNQLEAIVVNAQKLPGIGGN